MQPTRRRAALAATLLALLSFAAPSEEKKKPSLIDLALARAFPEAEIERVLVKFTDEEAERVEEIGRVDPLERRTAFAYVARREGEVIGTAFFDSHVVRTKRETLMVVVTPDGRVAGVETIVFQEPPDYVAQDSFYASLEGRGQGRALMLGRGLDGTTGATMTCRAVADAARRVLALHEVAGERVGRLPKDEPQERPEEKPKETPDEEPKDGSGKGGGQP